MAGADQASEMLLEVTLVTTGLPGGAMESVVALVDTVTMLDGGPDDALLTATTTKSYAELGLRDMTSYWVDTIAAPAVIQVDVPDRR